MALLHLHQPHGLQRLDRLADDLRLTANISHSTGSMGRVLPSVSSPPTIRSTRSSTTAVASLRVASATTGATLRRLLPAQGVAALRSCRPFVGFGGSWQSIVDGLLTAFV